MTSLSPYASLQMLLLQHLKLISRLLPGCSSSVQVCPNLGIYIGFAGSGPSFVTWTSPSFFPLFFFQFLLFMLCHINITQIIVQLYIKSKWLLYHVDYLNFQIANHLIFCLWASLYNTAWFHHLWLFVMWNENGLSIQSHMALSWCICLCLQNLEFLISVLVSLAEIADTLTVFI